MNLQLNQVSRKQLCDCGSGLSQVHCCDLKQVDRLTDKDVQRYEEGIKNAFHLREQGNLEAAEAQCVEILEQAPAHLRALRLLVDLKEQAKQLPAQEALLKRLVKIQPNDSDLACKLALVLYQKRDLVGADTHARNGIRLNPRNPQAHNLLGMILTDNNRNLAGEYHYRKALELHQPVGKLCANLGLNLRNQGKLEESEKWYRKAMDLEPDNAQTLLGWVKLEESRRDFDRAWELLHKVEGMIPENGEIMMNRSTLYSRAKEFDKALLELDKIADRRSEEELGAGYFLERGKVQDKLKRYDEAFESFEKGNKLIRESARGGYNEEFPRQQAARLKTFFKRSRMKILPRATRKADEPQPLFIIGFPRSGTTMTEQILTAHPAICAGDELTFIGDLTRFSPKLLNSPMSYPESFADLWMGENQEALDDLRDWYLKRVRQLGILEEGASWFTDKMPLNETHLGMIHLAFPESPIIHLLRHPLDVILSTFIIDLTHGHRCSYELKTAAQHYVLTYDLIEHYKQELDLNYQAVRYEDLVTDQEENVRKLLDFVGEPWDERCLQFHENKRYARTASYAQVTEKLYTTSRFRYKNYRKHLDEIIPMLEPVIERLGYTIED